MKMAAKIAGAGLGFMDSRRQPS